MQRIPTVAGMVLASFRLCRSTLCYRAVSFRTKSVKKLNQSTKRGFLSMRNARKVTRRRSVNAGLLARAIRAGRSDCRRRLRRQRRQLGDRFVLGRQARRGRLLDPGSRLPGRPRAGVREDLRGRGRQLQQLLRRLRRPEPRGRGRPARLRRPLRPGRRHGTAGRRRRARRQGLGQAALRRHRPGLGRRDQRPQGQPGGDRVPRRRAEQGRRRRHPEPVQLRRGALEHHGRLRHR